MMERFRTYSFVDRITSVQPGEHIRGTYAIPAGLNSFAPALVAEATGQLAAWAAKAAVGFAYQPVAGIAGGIDLLAEVRPGQTLDLEARLEKVDSESINYSGTASVDGVPVLRLEDCLGPMVSMEEFDDPASVRARFELLCGPGAEPGAFPGVPGIAMADTGGEAGEWANVAFTVPETAAFFGDHFPRRPVLPGTLMLDLNLKMCAARLNIVAPPVAGRVWRATRFSEVKMRSFLAPGTRLESRLIIEEVGAAEAILRVETRNGNRTVCNGRVHHALEEVAR